MSKKKLKTITTVILDASGSMDKIRQQAIRDYNEQIQQARENSKEQDVLLSLVTFNGEVYEHMWLESAKKATEASEDHYIPNGSTAMRDAIGYAIEKLKRTVKDDENTSYLFVIISDGEENSSQHVSAAALREMIEACQKTNRWTFSYIGCSEAHLKKVHQETSIPLGNMGVWSNESVQDAEFGLAAKNRRLRSYYTARSAGLTASNCLYSDSADKVASFVPPEDFSGNIQPDQTMNQQLNVVHTTKGPSPFVENKPVVWSASDSQTV